MTIATNVPLPISGDEKPVDLSAPGEAKKLSAKILSDVDEYCATVYDDGHRKHLGASLIGDECSMKLWGVFRWLKREKHTGRMQRLFNRGHREEDRFIEWLRGVGFVVENYDYENDPLHYVAESDEYILRSQLDKCGDTMRALAVECGNDPIHIGRAQLQGLKLPQFRISGVNGHFGGSTDGRAFMPPRYKYPHRILTEFKTNGTGRGFTDLCEKGVAVAKPQHFAQMSTYGKFYGFEYAVYMNINKNDDSLHVEVVKLNWQLGEQMFLKAEKIITSQTPPPKISEQATYFKCKGCNFEDVCHNGAEPEKSCRSCRKAVPIENSQWGCLDCQQIIPQDFIKSGCDNWERII